MKPQVDSAPWTSDCPPHLEGFAREFWVETAPVLEQMFLLSESDRKLLESAAVTYADWREAPTARDRRQLVAPLLSLLGKLGMTPADRLRMVVAPKEEPKRSHVLD